MMNLRERLSNDCSLAALGRRALSVIAAALFLLAGGGSTAPLLATPTPERVAPSLPPRRIEATATPEPGAPSAWMGVIFGPESRYLSNRFHAPPEGRVLVLAVIPDQPADRAGLRVGDWVMAINGRPVRDTADVILPVRTSSPGKVFRLRIVREGEEREVNVRVATRPGDADQRFFEHLGDRIRADDQDVIAYFLRAGMWPDGEVQSALADYSRAIQLAPEFEAAYEQRARLYLLLEEYENVVRDASRALELDPSRRGAYMWRATAYVSLGRNDEAIADSTQALAMEREPLAYALRGQAYLQRAQEGDLPRAVEDESAALALAPEYPFPYYIRGLAYAQMGKVNEAIFDLRQHTYLTPFSQSAILARQRLQRLTWQRR